MLDKHIYWINHIITVENKIAKKYWFTVTRKSVSQ